MFIFVPIPILCCPLPTLNREPPLVKVVRIAEGRCSAAALQGPTRINRPLTLDAWPFEAPQYLILNIAVGGTRGGQQGIDDPVIPHRLEVDDARVHPQ